MDAHEHAYHAHPVIHSSRAKTGSPTHKRPCRTHAHAHKGTAGQARGRGRAIEGIAPVASSQNEAIYLIAIGRRASVLPDRTFHGVLRALSALLLLHKPFWAYHGRRKLGRYLAYGAILPHLSIPSGGNRATRRARR